MFDQIKLNIIPIIGLLWKILSVLFAIISVLFVFISWDDIGNISKCYRLLILVTICLLVVLLSISCVLFRKKNLVWQNGTAKIQIEYGDLLKFAFSETHDSKIIVIPVNTTFDTIVDDSSADTSSPLISPLSLHGQWVRKILTVVSIEELDRRIKDNLSLQDIHFNKLERMRGKDEDYPIGTISSIHGTGGSDFYLLAFSRFDRQNNAYCSKEDFIQSIISLVQFYNQKGQGRPIYIPLFGTGLSRLNFNHIEALNKLLAVFELEQENIHGEVHVVVYTKDKSKVSILNTYRR